MTVVPVTPRLPAVGGGLQFYRDLDFHDEANDLLATGENIFTSEWPDKPLRLKPTTRQSHERPAHGASRADLIHGSGDHGRGRYARTPGPQSSAREGSRAGTSSENHQAAAPLDERTPTPRDGNSPPPSRGHGDPEELARPVWSPDAP